MKTAFNIILKISLGMILAAAGTIIVWFAPGDFNHDLAALVNKRNLLISKPPPRILFIGGSNLTTLNSADIERTLNRSTPISHSVVNLGLWGGLDIARYLEEIKPLLKPGDIVILCPEYAALLDRHYFAYIKKNREAEKFFFLISPGTQLCLNLRTVNAFETTKIIIQLNQLKMKTYLHVLIDGALDHRFTGGFYRYPRDYNSFGDRVFPFKVIRPLNSSGVRFQDPVESNIVYLKHFHQFSRKNGIRALFAFPPFPAGDFRLNKKHIEALYRVVHETLALDILTAPEDTVYPERYFADTVYHLRPEGENLRTDTFIKRLRYYLR
ncbi:MAG: hypothetical protein A2176_14450 [Spirochaetes bacterium RBG_13_51_14]|nr:MAG: hypothetical protein A2176_14450 [Spirochaetes bacterium RBG_13_51_14]